LSILKTIYNIIFVKGSEEKGDEIEKWKINFDWCGPKKRKKNGVRKKLNFKKTFI
jgi:hypothetical protein